MGIWTKMSPSPSILGHSWYALVSWKLCWRLLCLKFHSSHSLSRSLLTFCRVKVPIFLLWTFTFKGERVFGDLAPVLSMSNIPCWFGPMAPLKIDRQGTQCIDWFIKWKTTFATSALFTSKHCFSDRLDVLLPHQTTCSRIEIKYSWWPLKSSGQSFSSK